ncbi:porin [Bradyrhizobium cenepequi]|uniref:porin n=1 Tax=Bradyrhizobium cenepequi TaxID=2821403 RepID=UPI001CE3321A|nr:porin [Bradyrhizobium cenepequi]MCA6107867.1 porin [Bradyrhizobium cenepequi]
MRKTLIVIFALLPAIALAEQRSRAKSGKAPASTKPLPLKGAARTHSCAEYGAGFVRIEGSDTCIKIGGAIGIGGGVSIGGR